MINGYPTEEELENRIVRQLSWRNSPEVALIWRGYLNGLLEWGVIEIGVYGRLTALLPVVGAKEIYEMALDEPISPEQEREIEQQRENGLK